MEIYTSIYDTYVRDKKPLKGQRIVDGSKKARSMAAKDILALTKTDYIIHTTKHEIAYWEKLFHIKIDYSKVFIAPNCNVSSLVHRRSRMCDGIFRICWWGTFIPLHGLENIIEAIRILKKNEFKFECILFGVEHSLYQYYLNEIKKYGLANYLVVRKDLRFDDSSLPNYLIDYCDLALGIFGNTDKALNTIPNKLIEALSMRIPTLTMESDALSEFFNQKADLWTCRASPMEISNTIRAIASNKIYEVDWEKTRQIILKSFSISHYKQTVLKVLRKTFDDIYSNEILRTAED